MSLAFVVASAACGGQDGRVVPTLSGAPSRVRLVGLGPLRFGSQPEHIRALCSSQEEPSSSDISQYQCPGLEVASPFDRFDNQLAYCDGLLCGVVQVRYYPVSRLESLRTDVVTALRREYGQETSDGDLDRDVDESAECALRQRDTRWMFADGSSVRVSLVCIEGAGEHLVVQFGNAAFWTPRSTSTDSPKSGMANYRTPI
jgi:hypothetical protein